METELSIYENFVHKFRRMVFTLVSRYSRASSLASIPTFFKYLAVYFTYCHYFLKFVNFSLIKMERNNLFWIEEEWFMVYKDVVTKESKVATVKYKCVCFQLAFSLSYNHVLNHEMYQLVVHAYLKQLLNAFRCISQLAFTSLMFNNNIIKPFKLLNMTNKATCPQNHPFYL